MPGGGQRPRQLPGGLQRPPQRRLRIPARVGVHQRRQRRDQPRVSVGQLLAAPAGRPHPRLRLPVGLPHPTRHRIRVHPRRRRHHLDPAPPQLPRIRAQHDPPLPLIQVRPHHRVHDRQLLQRHRLRRVLAHTTNDRPGEATKPNLFLRDYLGRVARGCDSPGPPDRPKFGARRIKVFCYGLWYVWVSRTRLTASWS